MNPPTDNLYKFLAIGGLALFGFSVWSGWRGSQDLQRRLFETGAEIAVLEVNRESNKDETNDLAEDVKQLGKLLDEIENPTSRQVEWFERMRQQINARLKEVSERDKDARIAQPASESSTKRRRLSSRICCGCIGSPPRGGSWGG